MAMKRCLGRCGHLIATGSYCARCRPRNGSTRAWRQTRSMVLYRDASRCQLCNRAAVEVDHIVPVAEGGSDRPSNLRSLCRDCHASR
ncbi:MAG: HNH endonuclease [Actinobacteria bacterium]|nr:HNH endonuclease [Actinomycetota bacterium]